MPFAMMSTVPVIVEELGPELCEGVGLALGEGVAEGAGESANVLRPFSLELYDESVKADAAAAIVIGLMVAIKILSGFFIGVRRRWFLLENWVWQSGRGMA